MKKLSDQLQQALIERTAGAAVIPIEIARGHPLEPGDYADLLHNARWAQGYLLDFLAAVARAGLSSKAKSVKGRLMKVIGEIRDLFKMVKPGGYSMSQEFRRGHRVRESEEAVGLLDESLDLDEAVNVGRRVIRKRVQTVIEDLVIMGADPDDINAELLVLSGN